METFIEFSWPKMNFRNSPTHSWPRKCPNSPVPHASLNVYFSNLGCVSRIPTPVGEFLHLWVFPPSIQRKRNIFDWFCPRVLEFSSLDEISGENCALFRNTKKIHARPLSTLSTSHSCQATYRLALHISLQNPKDFRICEPFRFSSARFFYLY